MNSFIPLTAVEILLCAGVRDSSAHRPLRGCSWPLRGASVPSSGSGEGEGFQGCGEAGEGVLRRLHLS